MDQQLLRREMLRLGKGRVKNRETLVGHAQAFVGEKGLEFLAGRFGVHGRNFLSGGGGVNLKVGWGTWVDRRNDATPALPDTPWLRHKQAMIVGVHPLAGFDKLLHYRVPGPLCAAICVGSLVRVPVALGAITLGAAILYRFGPNRPLRWRSVWPGAVLATVLWLGATTLFAWYARHIANYNVVYGGVAAVILLLVWMYVLAVIALIGCEFNAQCEKPPATRTAS